MSPALAPVWEDARVAEGMRAQLADRAAALAAGAPPAGWKIGFGSAAALANLGIAAPLVGHLLRPNAIADGGALAISDLVKPALEAEVAAHLGEGLPAGASREQALQAIAGLGPAIEIADIRFAPTDPGAVVRANIFQRAFVLGPITCRAGEVDLARTAGRVEAGGEVLAAVDDCTANVGDVVDLVRHTADLLGAFDVPLAAGSVVITGSTTPIVFPAGPGRYAIDLGAVGSLSIELT